MFVSDCLSVNEAGHLTIGSVDTVEPVSYTHLILRDLSMGLPSRAARERIIR